MPDKQSHIELKKVTYCKDYEKDAFLKKNLHILVSTRTAFSSGIDGV
jgi:hypothetical protein